MRLCFTGTVVLVAVACARGPSVPPTSLRTLTNLSKTNEATSAKESSPTAWNQGEKHLALAKEAFKKRDHQEADRLANLGIIHLKIALARALQVDAESKVEAALQKRAKIEQSVSKAASTLNQIETRLERVALRNHLVSVTKKTARMAAAHEDARIENLTKAEKKVVTAARRTLGTEMLARLKTWDVVLDALVSKTLLDTNLLAVVRGDKQLAKQAQKKVDLLALQEHVEDVGIKSRRLIDDMWTGKEAQRKEIRRTIQSTVKKIGFENAREDFGLSIVIRLSSAKKRNLSKKVEALRSALGDNPKTIILRHNQRGSASLLVVPIPVQSDE